MTSQKCFTQHSHLTYKLNAVAVASTKTTTTFLLQSAFLVDADVYVDRPPQRKNARSVNCLFAAHSLYLTLYWRLLRSLCRSHSLKVHTHNANLIAKRRHFNLFRFYFYLFWLFGISFFFVFWCGEGRTAFAFAFRIT